MSVIAPNKLAAPPKHAPKQRHRAAQYLPFEEFLLRDFGEKHVEWVEGKVIEMSPVLSYHVDMSQFFLGALIPFVAVNELGKVFHEPYLMRSNNRLPARCPDIMFVKTENDHRITRECLRGPADLVIEIVSEESRSRDRGAKFDEYETGGVGEYWILDPERNRAEFYLRDANGIFRAQAVVVAADGSETYRCVAIPGVVVSLAWLWQRPMPSVTVPLRAWGVLP